jgi:hypothetical protein
VTERVANALDKLAAFWNTQIPLFVEQYGALMDEVNSALSEAHEGRSPKDFVDPVLKFIEYRHAETALFRRHEEEIMALRATDPRDAKRKAAEPMEEQTARH